jgi:hypothetical protein
MRMADEPTKYMVSTYHFPDFMWFFPPLCEVMAMAPNNKAKKPAMIWEIRIDWNSISFVVFFKLRQAFD